MAAASKLISGLTGERTRWTADVGTLQSDRILLLGDALLAASFLSYTGPFTRDYRHELCVDVIKTDVIERKIPLSADADVKALLTNDATVAVWAGNGLPADEHSVQNGVITMVAPKFPLCIDPQQQANNWIKNMFDRSEEHTSELQSP